MMMIAAARNQRQRRQLDAARRISQTLYQSLFDILSTTDATNDALTISGRHEETTQSEHTRLCTRRMSHRPCVHRSCVGTSLVHTKAFSTQCPGLHNLISSSRRSLSYSSSGSNYTSHTLPVDQVLHYLNSWGVDTTNHRISGSHLLLRECPFCEKPTNGKMDNLYKCYIDVKEHRNVYHCHRCGSGGSWYDLKKRLAGFEVESVNQVTNKSQQSVRYMSTAASASGYNMDSSKFSVSSSSTAPPSKVGKPLPSHNPRRQYEKYLKPPTSHPNHNRSPAPLPMPSQKLQALYTTELLDSSTESSVRKYLTETRGLTISTLRKYGVGQAYYRFPTDDNQWVNAPCVTFPWIMSVSQVEQQEIKRGSHYEWVDNHTKPAADKCKNNAGEDGTHNKSKEAKDQPSSVVFKDSTFVTRRIKVRAVENKAWQRMDPPGGGWGFFGWHTIPAGAKEVVVTEGEYDAMAVYQATKRPAISLPNGCRSLPVEVLPLLDGMEKIYLWMDSDAAGQEGAETFAKKLGLERTYLVRPTPTNTVRLNPSASDAPIKMPKDANEALLDGLDLERIIQDSKLTPHERIMTFENLREDVLHEILYPEKYNGSPITSLPALTNLMQGLRRGELTVLTGPTGSGKTTFLGQVSLDLAEQGTNVLWGSFEIKNTRLVHKLMQQFVREPLPKGDLSIIEKLHAISDRFNDLPLYFLTFHGGSDVDQVLEAMDYAVYVNDVEHIILDNMQFMVSRKEMTRSYDKFDVQDVAIEKFRQFATDRNVHITLVVHPRKENENEALSLASIYGSAKATQEADTVLILQSQNNTKWIEVKKNRFSGELGKCPLFFDKQSCRYTNVQTSPAAGGSSTPKNEPPSRPPPRPPSNPPSKPPADKTERPVNFWDTQFGKSGIAEKI